MRYCTPQYTECGQTFVGTAARRQALAWVLACGRGGSVLLSGWREMLHEEVSGGTATETTWLHVDCVGRGRL